MWRTRASSVWGSIGRCSSRFFQSSSIARQRNSFWGDRIRTVEDLNLRLSTCLFYNQAQPAEKLLSIARKERLPFNQQSVEYTILALLSQDNPEKAEELLDSIYQNELVPVSERMFFSLILHWAQLDDWTRVNKLFQKMVDYGITPSEKTYGLLAYQVVVKENDRYRDEFGFVSPGETLEKKLQSTTKDADFFNYIEAELNRPSLRAQLPHMQLHQLMKALRIPPENKLSFLHFLFRSEWPYDEQGIRAFPLLNEFRRFYSQNMFEPKQLDYRVPSFSFQGDMGFRAFHDFVPHEELEENEEDLELETQREHMLEYDPDNLDWHEVVFAGQNLLAGTHSMRRPFNELEYSDLFDIEKVISDGKGLFVNLQETYPLSFGPVGGVSPSLQAGVELNTVLGILTGHGVRPNEKLFAALVLGYGRGGDINGVQRIVDEFSRLGISPDARVLNCLIEVYARNGRMNEAAHLDWIRQQKNNPLHQDGYIALIYGFGQVGKLDLAKKAFAELEAEGFSQTNESLCALLYGYSKQGQFEAIPELFEKLTAINEAPELYEYKYIISQALSHGRNDVAHSYFHQLLKARIEPDQELLLQLFDFTLAEYPETHALVFEKLQSQKYHFTLDQYKANIKLLLASNKLEQALDRVYEMTQDYTFPDIEIFSLIIKKFLESKSYPEIYAFVNSQANQSMAYDGFVRALAETFPADKIVSQVLSEEGQKLNDYIWDSIVYYYAKKNSVDQLWDSLSDMNFNGFGGSPKLYATALYCFIKNERNELANDTLVQMKRNGINVPEFIEAASAIMRPDIMEQVEEFCETSNAEVTSMRDLLFSL